MTKFFKFWKIFNDTKSQLDMTDTVGKLEAHEIQINNNMKINCFSYSTFIEKQIYYSSITIYIISMLILSILVSRAAGKEDCFCQRIYYYYF